MTSGRICIDIKDGIDEINALECVKQVVSMGRISKNNTMFCYASVLSTSKYGDVAVFARDYRKSDCFLVCKHEENQQNQQQ